MSASPLSPVAPARIGTLLVPVGSIPKPKFDAYVERLQAEDSIRLGDISPGSKGDKNLFSPLAFPNGALLYNFMTSRPNDTHAGLAPFELFREALVVVALVDGTAFAQDMGLEAPLSDLPPDSLQQFYAGIEKEMIELRQEYDEAFIVQPLLFDHVSAKTLPYHIIAVPSVADSKSTTMRTIMCDLSSRVLAEMTALGRSVSSADFISSPTMAKAATPMKSLRNSSRENLRALDEASQGDDDETTSRSRGVKNGPHGDSGRRASSPSPLSPVNETGRPMSPSPLKRQLSSNSALDLSSTSVSRGVDRPSTSGNARDRSRDRRGVQSLIVSATERANNRLKSRQGLVIGSLYLIAGHWSDALRELVDNTTRARVFGDLIWYAKGLENILATMILLAWARIDFTIPPICHMNPEKYNPTNRHGRSSSFTRSSISNDMSSEESNRSMMNLSLAIPDLVHMIIDAYQRAKLAGEDTVPQYALSQCIIRLTHLLTVLHKSDMALNPRYLNYFVRGTRLPSPPAHLKTRLPHGASRDISGLIFEAFPRELLASSIAMEDIIMTMSGMVAVLSLAGLQRKRALIIREALSILIPRLIQARKVGAAEMGIHPAASLAARHGLNAEFGTGLHDPSSAEVEQGLRDLMLVLCNTFGVVSESDMHKGLHRHSHHQNHSDTKDGPGNDAEARMTQENERRAFGGIGLKIDVLRLSANFSEAMPNFADTLHFTSTLLRTTGPGSAPPAERMEHDMYLPPEEQARFVTKMRRTLSSFNETDAALMETEYWDRFLVRDVQVLPPEGPSVLRPLSKAQLGIGAVAAAEPQATGPLIFDPSKRESKTAPSTILVVGENADFIVSLQNLFDFEVLVEGFALVTEGVEFEPFKHSFTLGPRRMQQVLTSGVAKSSGELVVTGCRVKVQGCREEDFPIYRQPWAPPTSVKFKEIGLKALYPSRSGGLEVASNQLPTSAKQSFKAIPEQPYLAVSAESLSESNLDLFSGETKSFAVTVHNLSETVNADFVRITFVHAYQGSSGKAASQDLDEDDRPLTRLEPMRNRSSADDTASIAPLESVTFEVDVLGVEGLRESTIQIDYANLGDLRNDFTTATFYCRRTILPLSVSVNPTVRLDAVQVVPSQHLADADSDADITNEALMLDLTNEWATAMTVLSETKRSGIPVQRSEIIPPNTCIRLFIPCPEAEDLTHVVQQDDKRPASKGSGPGSPEQTLKRVQRAGKRSAALRTHFTLLWQEAATQRSGVVDLAPAYATLSALAQAPLSVSLSLQSTSSQGDAQPMSSPQVVRLNTPHVLTATLRNRTDKPVRALVRFALDDADPSVDYQPSPSNANMPPLPPIFAYTGVLLRAIQPLAPGASATVELGVALIARGRVRMGVEAREFILPHEQRRNKTGAVEGIVAVQRAGGGVHAAWDAARSLGRAECEVLGRDE